MISCKKGRKRGFGFLLNFEGNPPHHLYSAIFPLGGFIKLIWESFFFFFLENNYN